MHLFLIIAFDFEVPVDVCSSGSLERIVSEKFCNVTAGVGVVFYLTCELYFSVCRGLIVCWFCLSCLSMLYAVVCLFSCLGLYLKKNFSVNVCVCIGLQSTEWPKKYSGYSIHRSLIGERYYITFALCHSKSICPLSVYNDVASYSDRWIFRQYFAPSNSLGTRAVLVKISEKSSKYF